MILYHSLTFGASLKNPVFSFNSPLPSLCLLVPTAFTFGLQLCEVKGQFKLKG
jgi:hypothetical protein